MEGVKRAFMVFQQGGVIMDVVNADQVQVDDSNDRITQVQRKELLQTYFLSAVPGKHCSFVFVVPEGKWELI